MSQVATSARQPARLLVVDDDERLRGLLVEALALDDYHTQGAGTVAAARRLLQFCAFDLLLLDVNLPDGVGYELLRELRSGELRSAERGLLQLPVMLISGRSGEYDRIRGFEYGCDDYIVKPYSFGELRGRIRAVLRRQMIGPIKDVVDFGELRIDTRKRHVALAGRTIDLTHKEYALLLALSVEPDRVFERQHLLSEVWGYEGGGSTRTLDAHACRLRRKLSGGSRAYVKNTWGVGYRLFSPGEA